MANRKPYHGRLTALSAWALKAVGLVIAGAAVVLIGFAVGKGTSGNLDSPEAGKFVGLRHEAVSMGSTADTKTGVTAGTDQGQESSSDTVVRNGVTIVSPQLRVPAIDIDSIQMANGSDDTSVTTNTRKSYYAKRSHPRRRVAANRWRAYGLALR